MREILADCGYGSMDELFVAVGYSRLTAKRALRAFLPKPEERPRPESEAAAAAPVEAAKPKRGDSIRIKGVDNVLVSFAGCCTPLPGEPVTGYISRGRGVIVHTYDCPNLARLEPERLVPVTWEGEEDKPYPAKIFVLVRNRKGMLAEVSQILSEDAVNIDSGSFNSSVDGHTEITLTVEVKDSSHLYRALDHLRKLPDVIEVKRMVEESA